MRIVTSTRDVQGSLKSRRISLQIQIYSQIWLGIYTTNLTVLAEHSRRSSPGKRSGTNTDTVPMETRVIYHGHLPLVVGRQLLDLERPRSM